MMNSLSIVTTFGDRCRCQGWAIALDPDTFGGVIRQLNHVSPQSR
ncbi:hypothetical protein [Leptolyngbya iicbica]|nr:hypothetical protein [Leptolyngbya sp. LK]